MLSRLLIFAFIVMTNSTFAQTPTIDTGVSQALAKWRAANYSDVRYKLNLTLEKMSPTLKGTIEVRVKLSEPPASAGGSNSTIILDWRKIRGKEDLSTVSNVSINGKTLTLAVKPPADAGGSDKSAKFEETKEHLVFRDGVVTGENVIKLDFTSPIATSGAAITRYVDKEDGAEYVYSLFVPSDASTAFPVFDQPDLKARFQLNVLAPREWKVVSNTDIIPNPHPPITSSQESIAQETKTALQKSNFKDAFDFHFNQTKPISTYVFAFAAGDFTEFYEANEDATLKELDKEKRAKDEVDDKGQTSISLDEIRSKNSKIYVRKSQAEKFKQHAAEVFRLNREGIKYLETYFDYKFPFPKYDLVLIPEFPFGGMEHAGCTFLREDRVIFPTEPTKNDYITRANVIFHEAAHQWFGDTVTMRWFDDLWLKEGFAEFMAYKTLEKVMPEYNAWKIFYERNKQAAYLTDATRGTTPIYQEIPNLSAAKSAYGNIVYRKAPSFLRQAEFYLGEDKFQTAVRAFLKKHEFANAEWTDLVKEFELASKQDLKDWGNVWVKQRGMPAVTSYWSGYNRVSNGEKFLGFSALLYLFQERALREKGQDWKMRLKILSIQENGKREIKDAVLERGNVIAPVTEFVSTLPTENKKPALVFLNYQDYGYGIFLLDERSRAYVLENIQTEKDDFLRTMMWGALWDSVRETELNPKDYVALVIKNINVESDESTIQTLLGRVSTAMNYFLSEPPASAGGTKTATEGANIHSGDANTKSKPPADAGGSDNAKLAAQLEAVLIDKMQNAPKLGQRITFYRAFLNVASTDKARQTLKNVLSGKLQIKDLKLKTKDKFDIATKLLILSDKDAANLLAELENTETSDEAKRYAYAARAGIATAENKQKFFNDFLNNKEISESYIETALAPFNSTKHADLTLPFLENALKELPNLKRNRKIFFVNGWLSAFIGGQKSEQALAIVNKFLADNPNLDRDLRLKILENADGLERAVKIRQKFSGAK